VGAPSRLPTRPPSGRPAHLDRLAQRQPRRRAGAPAPGHLKRAADIFGFHLASLDMRQSSDIHERVLAELFAKSGVRPTTRA
jgi:phosphoenolpyruvate carboxylase